MVIRNPYGFIVKHYKIINLLLLIPMIYLILNFNDLSNFFRDYVANGYSTKETGFTETYITILSTTAITVMLIANILIYAILSTKKKVSLYNLVGAIYYVILLIASFFFSASLESIETYTMDATFANFVRDVSSMCVIPSYLLIIWGFSKAIGFNVKTFRLDNHSDLKISEEEDDDIEIKIGSDSNSLKRNITHLIRELRYYILENKFVFTCIAVVIFLIVGYTSYNYYQTYNKSFTINQAFSLENFSLSLKDSYITNRDYRGQLLSNDIYYLAIKIGIHNKGQATSIDKSNFRIYVGDEVLYPSYDKSSRFIDIGKIYQGEEIKNDESNDYVFVYKLSKEQLKSTYEMRILSGLTQKNQKLLTKYKKISIRPENIIKTEKLGNKKLNEEIDLSKTTLGETKFTLKGLKVVQSYIYNYESCDNKNNCKKVQDVILPSGGNALVIIEDELIMDENSSYYKNSDKDFYSDFIKLQYTYTINIGGDTGPRTKTANLKNVTPKFLEGKSVYEAPNTLLLADEIDMILTVRNKSLTIKAK
ncbi:MAG: hypothetical protein ACI4XM_03455 [Candidatus Coprovivens sp.]